MKIKRTELIGNYTIIRSIEDPSPNPVATEEEAFHYVTVAEYRAMSEAALKELFNQHIIYADPGPDGALIQDDIAEDILSKLADLNEHEKLQDNLEILSDWRGVEFWLKTSGVWHKQKIDQIGAMLPDGFIFPDNLTEGEIAAQEEMDRLTNLTAEQRVKEKEGALKALKADALRQKEMAEIADEQFDAKAWYQTEAAKINAKYT